MIDIQTKPVPTNTLKIGDRILTCGCLFEVEKIIVTPSREKFDGEEECHANVCRFIKQVGVSNMPKSWRKSWNEQGNNFATSNLVTSDTMTIINMIWDQYRNGFTMRDDLVSILDRMKIRGAMNEAGDEYVGYDYKNQYWIKLTL